MELAKVWLDRKQVGNSLDEMEREKASLESQLKQSLQGSVGSYSGLSHCSQKYEKVRDARISKEKTTQETLLNTSTASKNRSSSTELPSALVEISSEKMDIDLPPHLTQDTVKLSESPTPNTRQKQVKLGASLLSVFPTQKYKKPVTANENKSRLCFSAPKFRVPQSVKNKTGTGQEKVPNLGMGDTQTNNTDTDIGRSSDYPFSSSGNRGRFYQLVD